jgi:hypothetical protein
VGCGRQAGAGGGVQRPACERAALHAYMDGWMLHRSSKEQAQVVCRRQLRAH